MSHGAAAWVINFTDVDTAVRETAAIMGKTMPAELKAALLQKHNHKSVFAAYLRLFKEAPLREMSLREILKRVWRQEWARSLYFPALRKK